MYTRKPKGGGMSPTHMYNRKFNPPEPIRQTDLTLIFDILIFRENFLDSTKLFSKKNCRGRGRN